MKNSVHFIIQGKGGVGKSLIASMIAQYIHARGFSPVCADTDPVNSTFAGIKKLKVAKIPIVDNGAVIQRMFDPLFESMMETDRPVVVDTGSSTFLPLLVYMRANEVFGLMRDAGKTIYIHSVVIGGQAKNYTAEGLIQVYNLLAADAKVVVWQNEREGVPLFDGVPLKEMPWIKDNADKTIGFVEITDRNNDAYKTDMAIMTTNFLTLAEVMSSNDFKAMAKSRLSRVYNDVYDQLDNIFMPAAKNG